MTPKEKAEELVRKYYTFGLNNTTQSFSWYECKQCALIAVQELIDQCWSYREIDLGMSLEYWEEVKKEINKL